MSSPVDTCVLLGGVARSGTSWIGQIFDSSPAVRFRFQPLFAYAFQGRLGYDSSPSDYQEFLSDLFAYEDEFITQSDKRRSGQYPVFQKTRNQSILVFKENRYQYLFPDFLQKTHQTKFIGIIRNPCAVINSWASNEKEFRPGSDLNLEWRYGKCKNEGKEENFFGYYKWKEIAHLYLDMRDRFADRVRVVRYEDIVENCMEQTIEMFRFSGIDLEPQTQEFVASCHQKSVDTPYSVYKSKSVKDRWKESLPESISDAIYSDLAGTRLEQFLG